MAVIVKQIYLITLTLCNLAAVFGIPGETITHADQVDNAINNLVNSEGPYILHACIDDKENVWPLVPPGAANDQMLTEVAK